MMRTVCFVSNKSSKAEVTYMMKMKVLKRSEYGFKSTLKKLEQLVWLLF